MDLVFKPDEAVTEGPQGPIGDSLGGVEDVSKYALAGYDPTLLD